MPNSKNRQAEVAAANRVKAMSHPLRAKILLALGERRGSPGEVAKSLAPPDLHGRALSDFTSEVTSHIKYLVSLDCAEVVEERKAGNHLKCIYRATEPHLVETENWEALPPAAKDDLRRQYAQVHIDDLVAGLGHGMGLDKFFAMYRDHFSVDQQGLENLIGIFEGAWDEIVEEVARAKQRMSESGESAKRVSCLQGCFEIPPKS